LNILTFNWSSTISGSLLAAQQRTELRKSAAGAGAITAPRRLTSTFLELIAVKAVATPSAETIFAWFMAPAIRVATPFLIEKSLVKLAMATAFQFATFSISSTQSKILMQVGMNFKLWMTL